jgi:cyclophilin family peptidyl-prolyl cis-trans isomerase
MKRMSKTYLIRNLVLLVFIICSLNISAINPTIVEMETSMGKVVLKLYDKTPLHKSNFIKLVKNGFYEGITFHRVIKSFMAQAGDPNSRNLEFNGTLGQNSEGKTIPAEIVSDYFHKKGALAAARMGDQANPEKRSSGSQFYIVQGKKHTRNQLTQMEARINQQQENSLIGTFLKKNENTNYVDRIKYCQKQRLNDSLNLIYQEIRSLVITQESSKFSFSEEAIEIYENVGGTPFLDNGYTVFGEVIEGIDIVDLICSVATQAGDKPVDPVTIIKLSVIE